MTDNKKVDPYILLIDTSTDVCSVALAQARGIADSLQTTEHHAHVSQLAVLIDKLLKRNHLQVQDCSAIAVSEGPGSYTGLRVGVSTAKGLCYPANIPLIAVGSLTMLAHHYLDTYSIEQPSSHIVPMIDARRMEVYTAVFSAEGKCESKVEAKIIDANSFASLLQEGPVYFVGDGAAKCQSQIIHSNAHFIDLPAFAGGMRRAAFEALKNKQYQDIAYFTPFYLKDFVATTCKGSLLKR